MKILIVEDNMILCGMIEKWLQKAGYEVLTAIDEPGARSILKKNEINLVLGDVRLPEGDGISLLEWMMRSKMEVPFIVMTDYACITDAVRAIKLGAGRLGVCPFRTCGFGIDWKFDNFYRRSYSGIMDCFFILEI